MGAKHTKQPMGIDEFRQLLIHPDHYNIPEVPEKRKVTDLKFTIIFGICLGLLAILLTYSLVNSDFRRVTHGYDTCGNVCGSKNPLIEGIPCSGKDMVDLPILSMKTEHGKFGKETVLPDKCVDICDGPLILNRCWPTFNERHSSPATIFNSFLIDFQDVNRDLKNGARYIVALSLIGLAASIVMLLLFRFFPAAVVWVVLIGSLLGFVILTEALWYFNNKQQTKHSSVTKTKHSSEMSEGSGNLPSVAIISKVLTLGLIILLFCLFKKIKLVIQLFREAIKIVFGIPLILLESLLTFLTITISLGMFFYITALLLTSGSLQPIAQDLYEYSPNGVMLFTICFNIIMMIWVGEFISGCQDMVISGAVASYYFARDKSAVVSPIYRSFYNLIRYHLGTVAFGSLIITVITVIKALIRGLMKYRHTRVLVVCCLGAIDEFLKYLSKNAYIQTAMHGQPFYKSGKRAVRLLAANASSSIAINSVGDFVLLMTKLLVIVFTILMGVAMNDGSFTYWWVIILVSALITSILVHCLFSTVIDTIFLCYCEDTSINDGMTRPFYMSVDFMRYVEDAKALNSTNNCVYL